MCSTARGAVSPVHVTRVVRHRRERSARISPSQALGLDDAPLRWLPPTQGLYTHFEDVERWDDVMRAPPATAAVSAGRRGAASCVSRRLDLDAALQQRHHERRRRADRPRGRAHWRGRGRAGLGSSARDAAVGRAISFARARHACRSWIHAPRLAFRSAQVVRPDMGAAAVGGRRHRSAALDRLSADAARHRPPARRAGADTDPGPEREAALRRYEQITLDELDATEQLVAALYANMARLRRCSSG